MWGKRAEVLTQYLTKGTTVGVFGDLSTRSYEKDGQTRTSIEVRVDDVDLLGGGGEASDAPRPAQRPANGARPPARQQAPADDFGGDDEIPF